MKKNIYDYILIGGGCASLSLAIKIKKKKILNPSFLILEKRKNYVDDRSWCFWSSDKTHLHDLIEKSWSKWSFSYSNNFYSHYSKRFKYNYLRSITFYKKALNTINSVNNINLNLNERVLDIKKEKSYYKVISNKKVYKAHNILDTRPNINCFQKSPFLYQSFLGYEIHLKSNVNGFINGPHLMKNMRVKSNMFLFDYILPLKKNLILIETTIFSVNKCSKVYIENLLNKAILNMGITKYEKKREEFGIIPMGFIKENLNRDNDNYVYAGISGGAARASSGYTFLNIQTWAEDCSNNIKKKGQLIKNKKINRLELFLDKVFIKLIIEYMHISPQIFYSFLKRIHADNFVSFMLGNCKLFEYLKIILAMPKRFILFWILGLNKKC